MLAIFDQAKRELRALKAELERLAPESYKPEVSAKIEFLKSRALDRLTDIYFDSKATLDHIAEVFKSASIGEVTTTIDQALQFRAPLRRALGSEEDGRTVQALVDAAVWRSKFVWVCGIGALGALLIALAMLGVSVADLNKQAEAARKFFDDAKTQSQRSIDAMGDGVKKLKDQAADFEKNRSEIGERIDKLNGILNNPDGELNKVVGRFTAEVSRLGELEREWSGRRATLAAALTQHETFLTGKEAEVTQKTADVIQRSSEKINAVNSAADTARSHEQSIAESAASSKRNADTIVGFADVAEKKTVKLQELSKQTEDIANAVGTTSGKVKALQQESEATRDRINDIESKANQRLGQLITNSEGSKEKVDTAVTTALSTLASVKDTAIGNINRITTEVTTTFSSSQTTADRHLKLLEAAADQANTRSTEINRTGSAISKLQTDLVTKFEEIKTEEQRLKGERDRGKLELDKAQDIIKVVEDKRSDVVDKLHKMLDEKPSLDSAAVWKLILASNVLLALSGALSVALVVVIALLIILIRGRRRAPAGASGSA